MIAAVATVHTALRTPEILRKAAASAMKGELSRRNASLAHVGRRQPGRGESTSPFGRIQTNFVAGPWWISRPTANSRAASGRYSAQVTAYSAAIQAATGSAFAGHSADYLTGRWVKSMKNF